MLELKGWAINSDRKCHFPEEFFVQDFKKKGRKGKELMLRTDFREHHLRKDFMSERRNTGERSACESEKSCSFSFFVIVLYYSYFN